MKTLISVLLIAGFASATSFQSVERYSCSFPNKHATGAVTGQAVNIEYNFVTRKGTATLYPECRVCMVMPTVLPIEKSENRDGSVFKNLYKGFHLKVSHIALRTTNGVAYRSVYMNKADGLCYSQN
jgi:hypothetical protein